MLNRIKENMNIYFVMALSDLAIANMMLLIEKEHNLSLIMFAIVGVLIGIGELHNQSKRTECMLKKIIRKQREEIIYERMLDYEKSGGECVVPKNKALDELIKAKDE